MNPLEVFAIFPMIILPAVLPSWGGMTAVDYITKRTVVRDELRAALGSSRTSQAVSSFKAASTASWDLRGPSSTPDLGGRPRAAQLPGAFMWRDVSSWSWATGSRYCVLIPNGRHGLVASRLRESGERAGD